MGAARRLARERRGGQFDPAVADAVVDDPAGIVGAADAASSWEAVIAAEPGLAVVLGEERLDRALAAIADFVDLKSPYILGHARAVSELAAEAAGRVGLPDTDAGLLRRAGLVHDLGRLGISNAILDKRGPLGAGERERVRFLAYFTERMLRQSPSLAPFARVAVEHRERLDGSGYPQGLTGGAIGRPGRILGAADAYRAMREPRPHRPAMSGDEAAAKLRRGVRQGRFDGEAVEAVLGAAGHRAPRRREGPGGLTRREVEILRLLARGLSKKEIAARLTIAPKTVGNHTEHIYAKIGATSRAAAALFAAQHGLLSEEAPVAPPLAV